ncbi:MAG: hypothetical protein JO255_03235 [Alphaproteobacteria bacterium]|nr:hypothetical protein [Alphaproteobacteria bacterium]
MRRISPTLRAKIPAPAGWFELRYAVLADGSLGLMRATHDVRAAYRKHREQQREMLSAQTPGSPLGQPFSPLFPPGTMARFSAFDGKAETSVFQFPLDHPFPRFDRLDAQHWLVVAARCADGEANARLFDEQGSVTRRFCLGDGIKHVQCDGARRIWVGYFDEGVFGNQGWKPNTSLDAPMLGLNRFDENGLMTWAHTDHELYDCYAMNVMPDAVWACYYSNFPILRIDGDGHTRLWESDKAGASLLAVDGEHVVLLSGYGEAASTGWLARLTHEVSPSKPTHYKTETLGAFHFDLQGKDPRTLDYRGMRGDKLHFVDEGNWYVLSVSDVVRALS